MQKKGEEWSYGEQEGVYDNNKYKGQETWQKGEIRSQYGSL
jgi:hypothetical protein